MPPIPEFAPAIEVRWALFTIHQKQTLQENRADMDFNTCIM
jgi:hypothetical protein